MSKQTMQQLPEHFKFSSRQADVKASFSQRRIGAAGENLVLIRFYRKKFTLAMNKNFRLFVCFVVAFLFIFGLSSCTVISTGFWLDEIGRLEAKEYQAGELRQVYQGKDYVYVQVPIVFVQNRAPIIRHLNIAEMWHNVIPYMYPNNKNPGVSAPKNYFLQLPASYVKQGGVVSALTGREEHDFLIRLLSATEVNLTSCKRLEDESVFCPQELLPVERTWGNRLRQPLAWCGMVADIPLSVLATPIGWMFDMVSYPFADR